MWKYLPAFAFFLGCVLPSKAIAQSSVFQSLISPPPQGMVQSDLSLVPGGGTTISFLSAKERIETLFLDNKSFVAVTTDGCLAGLSECQPNNNNAPNIVHLSAIDKADIPGATLVNRINRARLTVVTRDSHQARRIYFFDLAYRPGAVPIAGIQVFAADGQGVDDQLMRGRDVAIARGLLVDPALKTRTDRAIQAVSAGSTLVQAAGVAQVSMSYLQKLLELGK